MLRPESSVSVGKNECGDLVFACDRNGPVVHRTPEELGIPREVPVPPAALRLSIWPPEWPAETHRAAKRFAERKMRHTAVRVVGSGASVKLSIGKKRASVNVSVAAEAARGKKDGMPIGNFGTVKTPPEICEKIVAAYGTGTIAEIAQRYSVSPSTVYAIWKAAELTVKRGSYKKREAGEAVPLQKTVPALPQHVKPGMLERRIEVDLKWNADALLTALATRDVSAAMMVRLELTGGEVAALVARLSDEQRGAFLAAGLKAAILG